MVDQQQSRLCGSGSGPVSDGGGGGLPAQSGDRPAGGRCGQEAVQSSGLELEPALIGGAAGQSGNGAAAQSGTDLSEVAAQVTCPDLGRGLMPMPTLPATATCPRPCTTMNTI